MIDPWTFSSTVDYENIMNQFGIKKFKDLLNDIKYPSLLMKRGIIFGHRDFNLIQERINKNKDFICITGMMPSGKMHIGHKMIVDQLKWYFENGGNIFISIADMEAYATREKSLKEGKQIAINEYLVNYLALGLDLTHENVNVYLQSQSKQLNDLAFKLSKKVNLSQMKAIYGFENTTNIAHVYAPLVQVADILLPQTEDFCSPMPTVVPVGIDQDPHIRLTRDLAIRFKDEFGFVSPGSTYHRFITGLTSAKMSSSKPKTAIFLNDSPELAEKKVKTAKTGGRESLKEQKELGGCPEKCVVYELLLYHLIIDDKKLEEVYNECKAGILLCGECKQMTSIKIKSLLEGLAIKRSESIEIAENILD
ncbi:MAG: tryptophan--tRNA ligase [Methanobrevibacter sp.]|nr:tryptophan--tRNA ligase [Candidatus Methanovirga meridionalis]